MQGLVEALRSAADLLENKPTNTSLYSLLLALDETKAMVVDMIHERLPEPEQLVRKQGVVQAKFRKQEIKQQLRIKKLQAQLNNLARIKQLQAQLCGMGMAQSCEHKAGLAASMKQFKVVNTKLSAALGQIKQLRAGHKAGHSPDLQVGPPDADKQPSGSSVASSSSASDSPKTKYARFTSANTFLNQLPNTMPYIGPEICLFMSVSHEFEEAVSEYTRRSFDAAFPSYHHRPHPYLAHWESPELPPSVRGLWLSKFKPDDEGGEDEYILVKAGEYGGSDSDSDSTNGQAYIDTYEAEGSGGKGTSQYKLRRVKLLQQAKKVLSFRLCFVTNWSEMDSEPKRKSLGLEIETDVGAFQIEIHGAYEWTSDTDYYNASITYFPIKVAALMRNPLVCLKSSLMIGPMSSRNVKGGCKATEDFKYTQTAAALRIRVHGIDEYSTDADWCTQSTPSFEDLAVADPAFLNYVKCTEWPNYDWTRSKGPDEVDSDDEDKNELFGPQWN
jgi:hypothetical protein